MVDLNGREIEGGNSQSQELKDLIEHWVQAIDRGSSTSIKGWRDGRGHGSGT